MNRIHCTALCALTWAIATASTGAWSETGFSDSDSEYSAVLHARHRAQISADTSARIELINQQEGEAFLAGDVLVQFDCVRQEAALLRARAQYNYARLDYRSNEKLDEMNSVSELELAESELKLAEATANRTSAQHDVDRCTVLAPFDGVVVERYVETFESVSAGVELMDIASNDQLFVEFLAPSETLNTIRKGASFDFHITETGGRYVGSIDQVVPVIDPVNRTVTVMGSLAHQDREPGAPAAALPERVRPPLWSGMSGWVRVHD